MCMELGSLIDCSHEDVRRFSAQLNNNFISDFSLQSTIPSLLSKPWSFISSTKSNQRRFEIYC